MSEKTDAPITLENPKQAHGDRKVKLHLVPPALAIAAARALEEGAYLKKPKPYGPFNWRQTKVRATTYIAGMLRHLSSYLDGEDFDPESVNAKHHLDGVAASLAILLDAKDGGFLIDDRPPKGPAPGLLRDPGMKALDQEGPFALTEIEGALRATLADENHTTNAIVDGTLRRLLQMPTDPAPAHPTLEAAISSVVDTVPR